MAKKSITYTPGIAVTQVALLCGLVVFISWSFSLLFGLPGALPAFLVLLRARKRGLADRPSTVWLGFYGAAVGSICALSIHILAGEFSQETLQALRKASPALFEEQAGEGTNLGDIWQLLPLYCLGANAFGGILGGALAERFHRRRRKTPPQ